MNLMGMPNVGDLFFDIQGVEKEELLDDLGIVRPFFDPGRIAWDPLSVLDRLLQKICSIKVRKIIQQTQPRIEFRVDPIDSLYPCVGESYGRIDPGAQIDARMLRLRGGRGLECDGSAKISGPVFIGPWCQIRHNGGLLGSVILGDGYTYSDRKEPESGIGGIIGHGVTVRRSIIRAGTKIEAHSEIVDSIIGRHVYIDAGAQFAHENFSGKTILIRHYCGECLPKPISTERTKLGIIIGDNCFVGVNVSMQPGVVLMPKCKVPSGMILTAGIYTPEYFQQHVPSY